MPDADTQPEKPARRTPPKAKVEATAEPSSPSSEPVAGTPASKLTSTLFPDLPFAKFPDLPFAKFPDLPFAKILEQIMPAHEDLTRFFPQYDKVIAFHKENIEALVEANSLFAKGAQELSKEYIAQAQEHLQSAASAGQAVFAAKTLQDAVQLNVDTAKAGFEKLVAGSTKLGELGIKLASEAFAPVKARFDVAVESMVKAA
jgi:phasin family protein